MANGQTRVSGAPEDLAAETCRSPREGDTFPLREPGGRLSASAGDLVWGNCPCSWGVREERGPLEWRAHSPLRVISGKSVRTSTDLDMGTSLVGSPLAIPVSGVTAEDVQSRGWHAQARQAAILPINPAAQRRWKRQFAKTVMMSE